MASILPGDTALAARQTRTSGNPADADLKDAARLRALQEQQRGSDALSIAEKAPPNILALFR